MRILLASASPRRRQLLGAMQPGLGVVASDVPEEPLPGESPREVAVRLALNKARAAAAAAPDRLVIGADTVVALDGEMLGKPRDAAEATHMLERLRGRLHVVYTGIALLCEAREMLCREVAETPVQMANYSDGEIAAYVASGDPLDKAGAYAIQSDVFDPVARFEGCYANVMGLPMCHVYRALSALGVQVAVHPLDACPLAISQGCPWSHGIVQGRACMAGRPCETPWLPAGG